MGEIPGDVPGRGTGDEEALGQIRRPDSAGGRGQPRAFGRATPIHPQASSKLAGPAAASPRGQSIAMEGDGGAVDMTREECARAAAAVLASCDTRAGRRKFKR